MKRKRLAVSLLRLGDVLMMVPALQAIKTRYSDDELHLLINENFSHVEPLLPFVDKIHLFPRNSLQKDLADPEAPILSAFDKLDHFLADLNRNEFFEVMNLTHNTLSACVTSLLKAENHWGLQLDSANQLAIQGDWFKVLNLPPEKMPWHFSEVYLRAAGEESYLAPAFPGCDEEQQVESRLLVQPFTSEDRKMWGSENWRLFLERLLSDKRFESCEVLAAPFEEKKAKDFVREMGLGDSSIDVYCCSLEQALSRIRQSQLLVTVDTSIKHLAAGTGISIIELALGGSRPEHTGAFRDNVLVLASEKDTAPSEGVFMVADQYIENRISDKSNLICNWGTWRASLSCLTDAGSWVLTPVSGEINDSVLDELEKYMNVGFEQDEGGDLLGSSAYNCVEALKVRLSPDQWKELARGLSEKETDCEESLERIRSMSVQLRSESSASNVVGYSRFKTFSKCIGRLKRQQEYNQRFLRTVKLHVMERL